MNSRISIVIAVVVLLALVGAGIAFFAGGSGPTPIPSGGPSAPIDDEPQAPGPDEAIDVRRGDPGAAQPVTTGRTEVKPASTGAEFHQGVVGRIVDANGAAVPEATVYLFDNRSSNMFESMIRANAGVIVPPIAEVLSDRYGQFQLGYGGDPTGRTFEIRAVHPDHAEAKKSAPQLFAEKFWDAGDIAMGRGYIVEGQVIDVVSRQPIGDAIIRLKNQQSMLTLTPTPGQEQGIEVVTDRTGHYRCANTGMGVWTISAVAAGYAQVEHSNAVLTDNAPNRFDFELPEGKSISGTVTNAEGTPISGAKLTAYAISTKMQMSTETRTGQDGRFELLGLVDGLFSVKAAAEGFVAEERKPVKAGSTEEHMVLEQQGGVHLRVVAQNGRRIDAYTAVLKSYIPERDSIGNMMQVPPHNVTSRLLQNGSYHLRGLDPGDYKVEVNSEGYAKAFSPPFKIVAGQADAELTVTLTQGGEIDATVFGMNGEPLAGAVIKTMQNQFQDNAIMDIFRPMIAVEISEAQAKSGPKGYFKLQKLIAGTYQVQITHPDYANLNIQDITVVEGQPSHLGDLAMQPGTLVTGSVTVDGQPTAQVKITVSVAAPDENTPMPSGGGISVTTFTDDQGQFTLPKRLPPGRYSAQAARHDPTQPFLMLIDFTQTRMQFQLMPGQTDFQQHFSILSNPPPMAPQNSPLFPTGIQPPPGNAGEGNPPILPNGGR